MKRLTEQVETSGVSLRDTVARSAESSVGMLVGTGDRLRNELSAVVADLGKTSVSIDQTVASAGERLASVQSGLASRVEEFQRALGGIASQVATLGRLSTATQADANALASQLSKNAESLGEVAKELAAQQQTLDATLEHRRDSLQKLVGDLSGRGEAFEATLGRFASTVEDSFGRAQARAQEISAALASSARGASVAVAGQFETIRETAAKERERTAHSLQAAIEQTNAQLSGALDQAAERFRHSVAEVKEMAGQVQRDLDATRQELRRGVLELPQETSETAEAMRRVVSDQIRALKELAALVSDWGAVLRRRRAGRDRRSGVANAAVRYERHQPTARAAESVVRSFEAPQREAALARAVEAPPIPVLVPLAAPQAPEPPVVPEAEPPAPLARRRIWPRPRRPFLRRRRRQRRRATARSRDGYPILLAAASRDEPESVAAPRGYETLEALTQGIAGLIDNVAAVEMWDGWRRGHRRFGVAPPLPGGGQQAFDALVAIPRRRAVPRRHDPLCAGVRAPAGEGQSERPRRLAMARLPAVEHRQGLHDPRPCFGPARVRSRRRIGSEAARNPARLCRQNLAVSFAVVGIAGPERGKYGASHLPDMGRQRKEAAVHSGP